jgi:predicted ATPase
MLGMVMKLSVENFGPIKKATIEVKPLTVIIGKNNLGKSFLAQLIYSSLSLMRIERPERIRFFRPYVLRRPLISFSHLLSFQPGLIKRAIKESATESEAVKRIIDIVKQQLCSSLSEWFKGILEQNFGTKTTKLVNINFSNSNMKFVFSRNTSLSFSLSKRNAILTSLNFDKEMVLKEVLMSDEAKRVLKKKRIAFMDCVSIQELVTRVIYKLIFMGGVKEKNSFSTVFYIPAGRAGLLESYDTVVSALVSLSPVAPLRGIDMPPLPGMASQFYNTIMGLRGRNGPLSVVSNKFKEILEGEIKLTRLREPKGKAIISYVFRSNGKERMVDIIHAASMVKELTPLYLIIRELVKPGDFLIIEEPESHLHPGAQLRLLEIFSDLVNRGVQIIMTTHSDLMLRKVAQLTGRYKLKEKQKEPSLDEKNVAIYWLKGERKGSVSREIKIGKYGTLEEIPTFDRVIKELYEEEVSLQTQLQLEE